MTEEIDILDFQKLNKNGVPYDILDSKIADFLIQERKMFVLNGLPYLYQGGVYRKDEDGKQLKAYIRAMIWPDLITINRINRVYNLILSDVRISKTNDEINAYPAHWVIFKNGVYDPILEELHEHSPDYLAVNLIPHELDMNASYAGSVADRFIQGLFPDPADREMFFRFAGYSCTRDTRLQKFLVLVGLPGSGKSTAINMLTDMIGEENVCSLTLQDLEKRFYPTELLGKLLNACADLPRTALEKTDSIKRATGEDLLLGEIKGGKVFTFRSYAKLIFSANEMPVSLDEKSAAFFRRLLAVEIRQKGEQIPGLRRGLQEGMPGFIAECMRALHRLYMDGGKIDSANSERLVHEFHRESDSVQSFLDDCIEHKVGARIERGQLYSLYQKYCWRNEWGALGNRSFFRNLRAKGYIDFCAGDHRRYFRDICGTTALICGITADFIPATDEENAVFARNRT